MKRVILESPFAGNIKENIKYAKRCVRDCLKRGEAPIASHLLFTQDGILNDENKAERALGIAAGLTWTDVCDYVVVYTDRGISDGMRIGLQKHIEAGTQIIYRSLNSDNQNGSLV